ncbi:MAG: hypothetical protein MRY21_05840 [Simkaniaceae bacterium]|nr:hypothetical protein [Simkaniaceae bacterium]
MQSKFIGSLNIFWQMLRRDMTIFFRDYIATLIDGLMMFITNLVVFAYFMPYMGMSDSYGLFIFVGALAIFGFFDTVGKVAEIIMDIEGSSFISYSLILPIHSTWVFIKIAVGWALRSMCMIAPMFLFGKLILWNRFDMMQVDYPKLILIFISLNLFYGFFSLWMTGMFNKISSVNHLWMRVINPMFMFGGYFFTWYSVFHAKPLIAKLILLNPVIYASEGMRAAIIGQSGFLPYWICIAALWGFTFAFGAHAIHRLKRHLDCV